MNTLYINPQSTDFSLVSQQVSHQECFQEFTHSTMPGTGVAHEWCLPLDSLWACGRGGTA